MTALSGKRILVVEDEPIVGMMVEDILAEFGAEVVGPAFTFEQAMHHATEDALDAAILDVNLNGKLSFDVAKVLSARGIPFVYATGYDAAADDVLGMADLIEKPYHREQIAAALERAMRAP